MYSSPPRHHLSFLRINNIWIGNQILTEIFARRMAYFFFSPQSGLVLIMIKGIVWRLFSIVVRVL